ncbi:ATP-binding cassette domain-containing protein [Kitasatospora sp. NPDC057904]|uniref:ATP-binding cassette domain-containing protein n=1 Tax=unclassified Kitasatospora TaxID=2633591 RepID=UPI0036D9B5F6
MGRTTPGADPVLSLRGAAVRVGGRTLWSGVDLTVGAGEFTAVLGPNGVGKSTLVKVLLGVLPAAAGEVRVLGGEPGSHSGAVGYLPQRRSFDASVRIRGVDVVRLGLDGDLWGGSPFRAWAGPSDGPRANASRRSSSWWVPRSTRTGRSGSARAVSSSGC